VAGLPHLDPESFELPLKLLPNASLNTLNAPGGRIGNHISLNSMGLPFAQIMLIENAARAAIRRGEHGCYDIYMDEDYFYSLQFTDYEARETVKSAPYKQKMSSELGRYFYSNRADLSHILTI